MQQQGQQVAVRCSLLLLLLLLLWLCARILLLLLWLCARILLLLLLLLLPLGCKEIAPNSAAAGPRPTRATRAALGLPGVWCAWR